MAQVGQFGSKVGSHLALFCIHRVIRVNSRNDYDSAINIVLGRRQRTKLKYYNCLYRCCHIFCTQYIDTADRLRESCQCM